MRINSFEQLKKWDLTWPAKEPGPWELNPAGVQAALGKYLKAIGVYWLGYSSDGKHASFIARYCGKAVRQPLIERLGQHVNNSHNAFVRRHLEVKAKVKLPRLWFRFVEFSTLPLAELVEGTMIAAFREEYEWNGRNEWRQHWALEVD